MARCSKHAHANYRSLVWASLCFQLGPEARLGEDDQENDDATKRFRMHEMIRAGDGIVRAFHPRRWGRRQESCSREVDMPARSPIVRPPGVRVRSRLRAFSHNLFYVNKGTTIPHHDTTSEFS